MAQTAILLDTNVIIDHFRGFPPAVRFLESLHGRGDVLFSAITETELLAGKDNEDAERRDQTLAFLGGLRKIPVANPEAALAGDLCRRFGLDLPDAIIAASALIHQSVLITRNAKDYRSVPDLRIKVPY